MEVDAHRRLFPFPFYERHLLDSLSPDGRPLSRSRDTSLSLGAVSSADGSALVKFGDTKMLAAIKLEVMTPSRELFDEGCLGFCTPSFIRHPTVKWAQRSDKVYLTIELPEAKDVKLKLELEGMFNFSTTKDGNTYEIDIELFDKINIEESKSSIGVRSIVCSIKKAEKKWWGRLLKQEGKPPAFLKVDWDRWVDEDDENEKSGADFDDNFSDLDMGGNDFDMDEFKDEEEEEATENEDKEEAAAEKENKEEQSLTEDVEETKA